MKFPGKRKTKHYFPVTEDKRAPLSQNVEKGNGVYIVGIDQLIVDIESHVEEEYLQKYNLQKGESHIENQQIVDEIYDDLKEKKRIIGEFAGGSIGNTLHNYAVLADDNCVALGAINKTIKVGSYEYRYICTTNSHVDLSYLKPCDGSMARAMCLITPDKERTFVLGKGVMNELCENYVPENVIANSSGLLISTYLLRDPESNILKATLKAVKVANENGVPVILSLGTSSIVKNQLHSLRSFIKDYVSILAGNEEEMAILSGERDPLLSCEALLEVVDFTLITVGKSGLYIGAFCDEEFLRKTKDSLHSKSISNYNQYEYSRAMKKRKCLRPKKIYTHINPFMGGPGKIENTNGAGDAALSAILHDLTANSHHRLLVPNSPKHKGDFLTYSSLHQVAKYANRASFEVLKQNSPRLLKGLPEKEDSLEESYWDL